MTKFIFGIIFGIIICLSVASAIELYNSEDILYSKIDDIQITVNDALNDLYEMEKELTEIKMLGTAKASDITEGETAVVQGQLITGTKSSGLSGKYILSVSGSFTTTTSGSQWGNWGWTAELKDSEGNSLGTVTAGVSRNQYHQFTGGSSASNSITIGS